MEDKYKKINSLVQGLRKELDKEGDVVFFIQAIVGNRMFEAARMSVPQLLMLSKSLEIKSTKSIVEQMNQPSIDYGP